MSAKRIRKSKERKRELFHQQMLKLIHEYNKVANKKWSLEKMESRMFAKVFANNYAKKMINTKLRKQVEQQLNEIEPLVRKRIRQISFVSTKRSKYY